MQYRKKRKKRGPNWVPKPITVKQIEWASDKYLERFVATEMQLRRVLKRRLIRNWRARGDKVTEEEKQMGDEAVILMLTKKRNEIAAKASGLSEKEAERRFKHDQEMKKLQEKIEMAKEAGGDKAPEALKNQKNLL